MPNQKNPTIECAKDGPLIVKGLTEMIGTDGAAIATKPVMALCRCGESKNKPFCDGTHATVDFSGERSEDRVPDKRVTYRGKRIAIHDNRGICSHAGYCTDGLKEVFRAGIEPWIDPDAASVERIDEIVRKCPSGALSYTMDGVERGDREGEPAVRITPHGPYSVVGGVELVDVRLAEGLSGRRYNLCRCGHSKNKPFCDGRHWDANFHDDGKHRVGLVSEFEEGRSTEVEVEGVKLAVSMVGDVPRVAFADGGETLEVTVDDRWGEVLIRLDDVRNRGG